MVNLPFFTEFRFFGSGSSTVYFFFTQGNHKKQIKKFLFKIKFNFEKNKI
jgi:hypothetical protein